MEELMGRRDGTVDARHDDDPSSASNLSLHVPARSCIHRWFYTTLGLSEPTLEDPSLMSDLPDEPTDANTYHGWSITLRIQPTGAGNFTNQIGKSQP